MGSRSSGKSTKRRSVLVTIMVVTAIVVGWQVVFSSNRAAAQQTPQLARKELLEVLARGDLRRLSDITTERGMRALANGRFPRRFLVWSIAAQPTVAEMKQWSRDLSAGCADEKIDQETAIMVGMADDNGSFADCTFVQSSRGWLLSFIERGLSYPP